MIRGREVKLKRDKIGEIPKALHCPAGSEDQLEAVELCKEDNISSWARVEVDSLQISSVCGGESIALIVTIVVLAVWGFCGTKKTVC
jgi:hypothetical protein